MLNDANGYGVENRHILFALLVSLLLHMALLWRFSLLPRERLAICATASYRSA